MLGFGRISPDNVRTKNKLEPLQFLYCELFYNLKNPCLVEVARAVKTAPQEHLRLTSLVWQECVVSDNSSVQSKHSATKGHFYITCRPKRLKLVCLLSMWILVVRAHRLQDQHDCKKQ